VDKRPDGLFRSFSGLEGLRAKQSGSVRRYVSFVGVLLPLRQSWDPTCSFDWCLQPYLRRIVHTHLIRYPIAHRMQPSVLQEGVTASSCPRNSSAPFYLIHTPFWTSGFLGFSHLVGAMFLTCIPRLWSGIEPAEALDLCKFPLDLDSRGCLSSFFFGVVSRFGCILGASRLSLVTVSYNSAYHPTSCEVRSPPSIASRTYSLRVSERALPFFFFGCGDRSLAASLSVHGWRTRSIVFLIDYENFAP
jgi:hypothetical protein